MRTATAIFVCFILGLTTSCTTPQQEATAETLPPTTVAPTTTTTTAAPTTTVAPTTTTIPPTTLAPTTTTMVAEPQPILEQPPTPTNPSSNIETLICQTFVNECGKALSVAWCESNHNTNVVGAAGERGLFQIHPVHIPNLTPYGGWDAMFDPSANVAYAYALYSSSGWGPWTCA